MRWSFVASDASPFDCKSCTERLREARNCFNIKGLSEEARAVTEYTEEISSEHEEKGAVKVIGLADLRLYECPLSYITDETREIIRLVFLVDGSGQLLHEGGWAGQPAWLVEAFEVFRHESARYLKERSDGRR